MHLRSSRVASISQGISEGLHRIAAIHQNRLPSVAGWRDEEVLSTIWTRWGQLQGRLCWPVPKPTCGTIGSWPSWTLICAWFSEARTNKWPPYRIGSLWRNKVTTLVKWCINLLTYWSLHTSGVLRCPSPEQRWRSSRTPQGEKDQRVHISWLDCESDACRSGS